MTDIPEKNADPFELVKAAGDAVRDELRQLGEEAKQARTFVARRNNAVRRARTLKISWQEIQELTGFKHQSLDQALKREDEATAKVG